MTIKRNDHHALKMSDSNAHLQQQYHTIRFGQYLIFTIKPLLMLKQETQVTVMSLEQQLIYSQVFFAQVLISRLARGLLRILIGDATFRQSEYVWSYLMIPCISPKIFVPRNVKEKTRDNTSCDDALVGSLPATIYVARNVFSTLSDHLMQYISAFLSFFFSLSFRPEGHLADTIVLYCCIAYG